VKLLFFISSLQCGGAQRVCVTLCDHWAERGWDVTLATFEDPSEPTFFRPGPGVRHVKLGLARSSQALLHSVVNNVRRVVRLRKFVRDERPERILSFIDSTNVLALIAAAGTGIAVVVAERVDPAHHAIPRAWKLLRYLAYRRAAAICVQTRSIAAHFPASWRRRIVIIPNPFPSVPAQAETSRAQDARRTIVAMGRLERQKGFDLLIRAFASVAMVRPEWDLLILGEGSERAALETQIAQAGLSSRVTMPGQRPEPLGALQSSDLFVLSSRYEGFPNALCEAMACGLPVISFDCPSGPADIVRDGVDGLLVPAEDVDALARAMTDLTVDAERRRRFGEKASELSARFSVERIAMLWERALRSGAQREAGAVEDVS
jgi:glycosyltransferase involved in cell wall biosynthesis